MDTPIINHFDGEYRFLSNFWPAPIALGVHTFPTVEHAYVAAKTLGLRERVMVALIPFPGEAKRYGRTLTLRPDWDEVKLGLMLDFVRQKFRNPALAEMLTSTGDAMIVEGNTWGDTFWGVCRGKGDNHLGKILMQVRRELQEG